MSVYVVMAGLPGTGKSTLAAALAQEVNGIVLSKDAVRAALFPGTFTDYNREQDDLCFKMVLDAAKYLVNHRCTEFVFLDGRTFSRREQIEEAIGAADDAGCGWRIILTTCPDAIVEGRLAADAAKHPAANRTVELYREIKARFELTARPYLEVDTSRPIEVCTEMALHHIGHVD